MLWTIVRNLMFLTIPLVLLASFLSDRMDNTDRGARAGAEPSPVEETQSAATEDGSAGTGTIVIDADTRGHFLIEAEVNDGTINFLVDTGATSVALGPDHLEQLGIEPGSLKFNLRSQTANGTARAARVTLDRISIGEITVNDVEAVVMERPLGTALLGMSFLSRLEGYEVRGDRLFLKY
jgi:aspartyl protease family protein